MVVKVEMVGAGPMVGEARQLTQKLGLESQVDFLGRLPIGDLARVIQASHVNIHTSVAEGWGYSIMEAAASGVPTVAYRAPGVIDAVLDGQTGLLVRRDSEALANGIQQVLASPGRWQGACRAFAEKHTWDVASRLWEELLTSIATKCL